MREVVYKRTSAAKLTESAVSRSYRMSREQLDQSNE